MLLIYTCLSCIEAGLSANGTPAPTWDCVECA